MTTTSCLTAEELPGVLALPPDHPRRRHLLSCPHCRALHHAYGEFLDPADPDDPDLDEADARLDRRLHAALAAPARRRFDRPHAMLAAAAVLVLCAGILGVREAVLLRQARLPEGTGQVRGLEGARWELTANGWRLAWSPAQAGWPVVQVLDGELRELARRPLPSGPVDLPAEAVHLRLLFVAAGDTVGRSDLLPARPPDR
jgi:hypothetical protein